MFYAHIVLAKKGPFARIWLAAHWDKKLTKAHVFETNIEQSVEGIMQPKVKLALRTSGHLLLGVVRIYSRKAKYLLADCNEAFVKIKMAFRPGMVDLPEEHREAAVNAITLPEVFHDFDTALPELNDVDIEAQFSINQSRADEITMREDYGSIPMSIHDEGFGDMALDDIDFAHTDPNAIDENLMDDLDSGGLPGGGGLSGLGEPRAGTSRSLLDSHDVDNDGFGDTIGTDGFGVPANGLFEGDLFADAPLEVQTPLAAGPAAGASAAAALADPDSDDDMDDMGGGGGWADDGAASTAPSSPIEFQAITPSKGLNASTGDAGDLLAAVGSVDALITTHPEDTNDENNPNALNQHRGDTNNADGQTPTQPDAGLDEGLAESGGDAHIDQTTLLHNEEESFALAPVDASALKGVTKAKRKRKLIVDEVKNISGEEMKSQLANTSDIITTLDLAPPTKRLMYWKDTGGVEKVFALCSRDIKARVLFKNNQRHFQLRTHHLDDFSQLGPSDVLALDQYQQDAEAATAAGNRRGRKRKLAAFLESPPVVVAAAASTTLQQTIDDSVERFDGGHAESIQYVLPIGADKSADADESALIHTRLSHNEDDASLLRNAGSPYVDGADQLRPSLAFAVDNATLPGGSPFATPHHPHHLPDDAPQPLADNLLVEAPVVGNELASLDDSGPPDMTPGYSADYDGAADIQSPAYVPSYGGGVTPHHPMVEQLDAIPNLPADQVQSILNDGLEMSASERVASDWSEPTVFDFPPEVATHQPGDEQLENETDEAFEERVLNKRAAQMFVSVRARMQTVDHMYLSEMTQRNNRKQAAQKFYSLLVLKKFRALDIRQDTSYGDILVTKGTMFDNPKL